jgi:hypothetical protein
MDLSPSETQAVDRLAPLYEKTGSLPELIKILEHQANSSTEKAKVFALRKKLGSLHARGGDIPRAAASLRQAVELKPEDVETRVALAELLSKEPATTAAGVEEHRQLLRLHPFRVESMHALYKMYEGSRQPDRALCVASVLAFLRASTEVEVAWFSDARTKAPDPARINERLMPPDVEGVLSHPVDRGPLSEMMRIIGGDLHKVHEPDLARHEVHPKNDRLKPDHPIYRIVRHLADVAGADKLEVYLAKRGAAVTLENTEPLGLIASSDFCSRGA